MLNTRGPWVDIHAHPGRCFLAGLGDDHPLTRSLGGDGSVAALQAARSAGLAAVSFATVADLVVLTPSPDGGLRAGREFRPGEAHADHLRQLEGLRQMLDLEGVDVAMGAADLERAHREGQTAVLITCEGGDFLEGRPERVAEAHQLGMSSLTLVHYRV
ncbi:MAG: membrane dipeptidase, partial [Acidimicrobiia bacterium]